MSPAVAMPCQNDLVENEAFYATSAQVIPTLLIALAIEMSTLLGAYSQRSDALRTLPLRWKDGQNEPVEYREDLVRQREKWVRKGKAVFTFILVLVVLAETGAVLGLIVGLPDFVTTLTAGLCVGSIAMLTAIVMILPMTRIRDSKTRDID